MGKWVCVYLGCSQLGCSDGKLHICLCRAQGQNQKEQGEILGLCGTDISVCVGEAGGDLRVVSMKAGNGGGFGNWGRKVRVWIWARNSAVTCHGYILYIHQCAEEKEEALAIGSPGGYQQNSLATKS